MIRDQKGNVLTVGDYFEGISIENGAECLVNTFSIQAIKAYIKGFLHLIPLTRNRDKSPNLAIGLMESDASGSFLQFPNMLKETPPNRLDIVDCQTHFFWYEKALSWMFLERANQPTIPKFIVAATFMLSDKCGVVYKICEYEKPDEAKQFIEKTTRGIENHFSTRIKNDPSLAVLFSRLYELQFVRGLEILLLRMPEGGNFNYHTWWQHENLVINCSISETDLWSEKKNRDRILNGKLGNGEDYQAGLEIVNVFLKKSPRLKEGALAFDKWQASNSARYKDN